VFSYLLNRLLQLVGTYGDLRAVCCGAGYSQHQRRGISKVALQRNWPSSLRQASLKLVEAEVDIAKLLARGFHPILKLNPDNSSSWVGCRTDSIIRCGPYMDELILCDRIFHRFGDKLLDLFRCRSWPVAGSDSLADWDVWIFSLRHVGVAVKPPNDQCNQRGPGNLGMFDKESRCVMRVFQEVCAGFMFHVIQAPELRRCYEESVRRRQPPSRSRSGR